MEWSDLRIFLAIAREGTLGAAARKLAQTQPTMGRRLRVLEDALGHKLFQRTKDGQSPSMASAQFERDLPPRNVLKVDAAWTIRAKVGT